MTEPMSREDLNTANRARDEADLAQALRLIRAALPTARWLHLQTSDQGAYGFVVYSVENYEGEDLLADGWMVPGEGVHDQVAALLGDLDWNGVVGEDKFGCAAIDLREPADGVTPGQ